VRNRDIPALAEILSIMQTVCEMEERRGWQKDRMAHITQNITGMPGGGGIPKGLDDVFALLSEMDGSYEREIRRYTRQLKKAQKILNGIESANMRAFVTMKYVMGMPDKTIQEELNLSRRGLERARKDVEEAPDMAGVKWHERFVLKDG